MPAVIGLVAVVAAVAVIFIRSDAITGRPSTSVQTPGKAIRTAPGAAGKLAPGPAKGPGASAASPDGKKRATKPITGTAPTVRVAAVGDMEFDREVRAYLDSAPAEQLMSSVSPELASADYAFGNLEGPLSNGGTPQAGKDVVFRGHPRGADALESAGIDAVSMANNHALDYGPEALKDTRRALDARGIAGSGAGMTPERAYRPATVVVKADGGKAKVSLVSFSYIIPDGFYPYEGKPGIAAVRRPQTVSRYVRAAKKAGDYVVASFHWGVEYQDYPIQEQRRLAKAAIDSGADLVLGHHPHVIQGIEVYRGRVIAYSLGDFVFDHYSRKTGEAFILRTVLGQRPPRVRIIPVYLSMSGRPQIVHGAEARAILTRLASISETFGTRLKMKGDVAVLAR